MRVIKKINNNVALCIDDNDNELIAFGKGIGFLTPPYEVKLSQISRTYYGINKHYIEMINDIPEEILELSIKVVEYARSKIDNLNNANIVITLADHINFAIERYKKKINVRLPIIYDIQYLFDVETEIGNKTLLLIKKDLGISLPKDEAAYIALHIINAETMNRKVKKTKPDEKIIEDITKLVEDYFNIKIDKDNFNYSRFVTHMYYFLKRGEKNEFLHDNNNSMYNSIVSELPETYECYKIIKSYLEKTLRWELTNEESMYLILHINRLCFREDCS